MTLGLGLAVAGGVAFQPNHTDLIPYEDSDGAWRHKSGVPPRQWKALYFYDSGALLAGLGATALGYGVVASRMPVGNRWKTRLAIGAGLASLGLVAALSAYKAPQGLEDVINAPPHDLTSLRLGGLLSVNMLGFALIGSGAALLALAPTEFKLMSAPGPHVRARLTPHGSLTGVGVNLDLNF